MKKIALLLALALAFTSIATAADVAVGGWLDVRGDMQVNGNEAATDEEKEASFAVGSHEFEVAAVVTGENFGARAGILSWSGSMGHADNFGYHNTYIYADFVPNMLRVYAGYQMFPVMYTSWAPVEKFGSDCFGAGLGAFNYAGNWDYGRKPTGLIAEIKPTDMVEFTAILNVPTTDGGRQKFEDVIKNGLIFAGKVKAEVGTFYAGTALRNVEQSVTLKSESYSLNETTGAIDHYVPNPLNPDDYNVVKNLGNAFWLEADLKLVENLLTTIKFEMFAGEEDYAKDMWITAGLGYTMDAVAIRSEINQIIRKTDDSNETRMLFSVAPTMPVVNPMLYVKYDIVGDAIGEENPYGVGVNLQKSFGNASTNLYFEYESKGKDLANTTLGYKVTCWF